MMVDVRSLYEQLLPHQKTGVEWMIGRETPMALAAASGAEQQCIGGTGGGGVLGDDMGMGKTLQMLTLVAIQALREKSFSKSCTFGRGSTLVVCPQSVLHAWHREAEKWIGWKDDDLASYKAVVFAKSNELVRGRDRLASADLVIVSYETVDCDARGAQCLQQLSWRRVVLDEAHRIRNAPKSCACIYSLCAWSKWACTGTLFHNGVEDVGNVARFLGLLPYSRIRWWRAHKADMDKITQWRNKFYLSRSKEILKLPPVVHEIVNVPLDAALRNKYDEMLRAALANYVELTEACATKQEQQACLSIVLGTIRKMRQFCNHQYMCRGKEFFDRYLDSVEAGDETGHRLLVNSKIGSVFECMVKVLSCQPFHKIVAFSQWRGTLKALRILLAKEGIECVEYVGAMSVQEKQEQIDAFQGGKSRVMLVSLRAGGVGINLNTADHVYMVDGWYNPFLEAQAVDRVNRIGQKHAQVHCVRFHVPNTVEDDIVDIQQSKKQAAQQFYSGIVSQGALSSTGCTTAAAATTTVKEALNKVKQMSAHKVFRHAHAMSKRSDTQACATFQANQKQRCRRNASMRDSRKGQPQCDNVDIVMCRLEQGTTQSHTKSASMMHWFAPVANTGVDIPQIGSVQESHVVRDEHTADTRPGHSNVFACKDEDTGCRIRQTSNLISIRPCAPLGTHTHGSRKRKRSCTISTD